MEALQLLSDNFEIPADQLIENTQSIRPAETSPAQDHALWLLLRATGFYFADRDEDAFALLEARGELFAEDDSGELHALYGQVLFTLDKLSESRRYFDRALDRNQQNVEWLILRAELRNALGDVDGAWSDCYRAEALEPNSTTDLRKQLGP